MTKSWMTAIAAAALIAGTILPARADDHAHAAAHGGLFALVEDHHGVELVISVDALTVYLTEDGKPMDLTGAHFKAVVQSDAGTAIVPLTVDGVTLKGALSNPLPSGAKVVISGKDRDGHPLQARFIAR